MNRNLVENNILYSWGRGVWKTTTWRNVAQKTETEYRDVDIETTDRRISKLWMSGLAWIVEVSISNLEDNINNLFISDDKLREKIKELKPTDTEIRKILEEQKSNTDVMKMIKEGTLDIKTYSQIVWPEIWHIENSYFRDSESDIFWETFFEASNIVTWAGTLKSERNRIIAQPSFKLLFVIDTKVQLERIFNDPDGNTRRWIIGSTDWCSLSPFEREKSKLEEYDRKWLPILKGFADRVIDVTKMNEHETMNAVLEIQRVQDILQYNG